MMAAMRGYKAVITTSPKCSQEKMDSIRAYGATLVVRPSPHTRCPARALTAIACPRRFMQPLLLLLLLFCCWIQHVSKFFLAAHNPSRVAGVAAGLP